MEIDNPLNRAEILSQATRKPQEKQDSKIANYINGPWYFNKTNTFSSFEDESIGSIQFNGGIIKMMSSIKLV